MTIPGDSSTGAARRLLRADREGWRSTLFAAIAGGAIALAGAPLELSFPAFLAPGFLMIALELRLGTPVPARRALLAGLVMGVVTNAISTYWVVGLLQDFARFPLVAALPVGMLLFVGQSLPYVVAALLSAELMRRRAPGWLVVPACLTVAETLSPAIFPWRYGLSQLPNLPYAQVAELGGLPLLDWLVATVGCGALASLRLRRRLPAVVALLAFALPGLYGTVRLPEVRAEREGARAVRVGVVQPNVGIREKHTPFLHFSQLRALRAATAALEARGTDLVVWPESSYPFPVHREATRDRDNALGLRRDGVRGPLLVGVITTSGRPVEVPVADELGRYVGRFRTGTEGRFNSALAVERDGSYAAIADKVKLLVFGEYTPFWEVLPPLQRFPRGLTPGTGSQIVELAGARIGVLNCYEDLLPSYVRAQALGRPDFWVNVTNNAWFGDTNAPHLHHMNARMRAIETRRDLVRAVNTGVSGHTAATGEDSIRTGTFVPDRFIADVRVLEGVTPWVRFGDWVTPLLAGALLGLVLSGWRRRGPRSG